jgi:hypothetical protein
MIDTENGVARPTGVRGNNEINDLGGRGVAPGSIEIKENFAARVAPRPAPRLALAAMVAAAVSLIAFGLVLTLAGPERPPAKHPLGRQAN